MADLESARQPERRRRAPLLAGTVCRAMIALLGSLGLHTGMLPAGAQETATAPAEPTATATAPPTTAPATSPASQPSTLARVELSADLIQAQLKQIQEDSTLDEEARKAVDQEYKQALTHLQAADKFEAEAKQLREGIQSAPGELEAVKAELAQPRQDPSVTVADDATLVQLEQSLNQAQSVLTELQNNQEALQNEAKRRSEHRAELAQLAGSHKAALERIQRELAAPAAAEDPPALAMARRTRLVAQEKSLKAELAVIEQRSAYYDATAELLTAQRDLAARTVSHAEKQVKAWQRVVQQQRRQEAEARAREALRARAMADPAVRAIADENTTLTRRSKEITSEIDQATHAAEETEKDVERLREDFRTIREKVEKATRTRTIGLHLRRQQESLPPLSERHRLIRQIQREYAETEIDLIDLEKERRPLITDLDDVVAEKLEALGGEIDPANREYLGAEIRDLLVKKREYLRVLIADHEALLSSLESWETAESELVNVTEEFAEFIDQHIWWVRSSSSLNAGDLREAAEAAMWLAAAENWRNLVVTLIADLRSSPAPFVFLGLTLCLLLALRRRTVRRLAEEGDKAAHRYCASFRPTLAAVWCTALLAAPIPLLLWFLSWRLSTTLAGSDFDRAVAAGLDAAAGFYAMAVVLRHLCRPNGLGESHIRWPAASRKLLLSHLMWLTALGIPLLSVSAAMAAQPLAEWRDSLGRECLIVFLVAVSVFAQRTMRPRGGIFSHLIAQSSSPRTLWMGYFAYALSVGSPLILAILTGLGYYYTTSRLISEAWTLVMLMLVALLLYSFSMRWIMLAHRRLAVQQARDKRAAQKAAEASDKPTPSDTSVPVQEAVLDVTAIGDQTRQLVRTVFYCLVVTGFLVFSLDLLPAFEILKSVPLWPGAPITLASLTLAIVVTVIALLLSRNLPGFLEMTLLRRLPLDAGGRYAISTITRYLFVVTGVILASSILGLGWSQVQWLVAAVTVGLGFGLQEIFANLVSGIIILLERPVRVGDTVTVGEITGTVTRIRIRATTIIDWDRKELIIPNKEFVTGQVINWTLSDPILRVIVPVGIAYGSDTDLAERLLMEAAEENPHVLDDPPPRVLFLGFGDSSLNYDVRVFVPHIDYLLQTKHELHRAIDQKFRQAGVEIAFPQRDLHVRSMSALAQPADRVSRERSAPMADMPATPDVQDRAGRK